MKTNQLLLLTIAIGVMVIAFTQVFEIVKTPCTPNDKIFKQEGFEYCYTTEIKLKQT